MLYHRGMRSALPVVLAIAAAAGCGAKLGGEPSVVSAPDAGSSVGPVDGAPAPAIDAAPDARPCTGTPDGEGHCYLYNPTMVTWAEASAACIADHAYLAIIKDATQNATVAGLLDGVNPAFIGATDQAAPPTYLWVDGTPLTYTNFNTGEPNDGGGTHAEDCLAIRADAATLGTWDDRPCAPEAATTTPGIYPYVCEF